MMQLVSGMLTTQEEIKLVWDQIEKAVSVRLFDSINDQLDKNKLKVSEISSENHVLVEQLLKLSMDDQSQQYLEEIEDGELKKPAVDAILSYFIKAYVDAFATVKTEPSKRAIANIMSNALSRGYDDILALPILVLDEPDIEVSSSERRYIFSTCHASYFSSIIRVISRARAEGRADGLSANEVIQSSDLLREEYQSLIAFDRITSIKNKLTPVRAYIETYVNQVILMCQLDDTSAPQLMNQIRLALGAQETKRLYQAIKASKGYPTSLDMLDNISEELRGKINGIDLFLNLPGDSAAPLPLIRMKVALINNSIDMADAPKSGNAKPFEPAQSFTPKPSVKPPLNQSFNFFNPKSLLAEQECYRSAMEQYKLQNIAKNKNSNCSLFYEIANGLEISSSSLKNPQRLNIKDDAGNNALHLAALCGDAKAFSVLRNNGFIENPKNGHGYTLLNLALLGGSPDIVRELVRQVDVHEKNDDDKDSFLFALYACPKNSPLASILMESVSFNFHTTY